MHTFCDFAKHNVGLDVVVIRKVATEIVSVVKRSIEDLKLVKDKAAISRVN